MDRPRDELLARAGLAEDEHARVRRRDVPHLLERGAQCRRVADDLLEVVLALDLLLQVAVLLLQPFAILFGQHAGSDVDDHRPSELAVRIGLRPELHPDRAAVVLAPELELDLSVRLALLEVAKCVVDALVRELGRRQQLAPDRAHHLFGLEPEQTDRGAVGADETCLRVLVDVGNRRFFIEVPKTSFGRAQQLLRPQTLELGRGARREDL